MADDIFADFINNEIAECTRCGKPCRIADSPNPEGRLMVYATPKNAKKEGLCVDCAATAFIKGVETLMVGINLHGAKILLDPRIQENFAKIMTAGHADAHPAEINWQRVVENWDLPLSPKHKKR